MITTDGARIGIAAGGSGDSPAARGSNRMRRNLRALPIERTVIRGVDRTVPMPAKARSEAARS